jgi:hypothetical protein
MGQFEIPGLFGGTGFSRMVLPHSGQTPLAFPVKSYPQMKHWPRAHRSCSVCSARPKRNQR